MSVALLADLVGDGVNTGRAPMAAPSSIRSAKAWSWSSGSKSWRTTPNGNSCSSSPPRATSARIPASVARRRASATSRDLPIPGGPSMRTAQASPAIAAWTRVVERRKLAVALEQCRAGCSCRFAHRSVASGRSLTVRRAWIECVRRRGGTRALVAPMPAPRAPRQAEPRAPPAMPRAVSLARASASELLLARSR